MGHLNLFGIVALCAAVATPGMTCASPRPVKEVRLPAQPLRAALQTLARLYQVELLFSDAAIGTTGAPAVSGKYRIDDALKAVLDGTGFVERRTNGGGYIVVRATESETEAATAPVPEIVVVGRRTQNADIRRFTNDVQPYQVLTRADIRSAHASTVEELIGKRMSADARGVSFMHSPISGQASPQSTVNLRGLGADETLVLVDGRAMPRLPGRTLTFVQSDVNAVSPESIERAEIATSTAGGIYGPGAIAGVINLVLRRDYRGAALTVTSGVTQRGDAPQGRVDARIGFTPDHGATDVMVSFSRASSSALHIGDRDFAQRANDRILATAGAAYEYGDLPVSDSVNIAGSGRVPLTFKPEYGGGALGSFITTLPPGNGRSAAQTAALLLANAGRLDTTPSSSEEGRLRSLTVAQETSSILATIRHQFGGIEIYGDFIRLVDKGAVSGTTYGAFVQMSATDPNNPFQQDIDLSLPFYAYYSATRQRIVTTRGSVGAVVGLPAGWKANLDLSLGSARQELRQSGETMNLTALLQLAGFASPSPDAINPLGDSTALQAALASNAVPVFVSSVQTNRMSDLSVRLSGPVMALPGGALFATILAEQRYERVAPTTYVNQVFGLPLSNTLRGYSERVRSAYVEVRAPLVSDQARFAPLRGLEVQVAARIDATRVNASPDPKDDPQILYERYRGSERPVMVFTAGVKVRPLSRLLLRASLATGETSPPLQQLAGGSAQGAAIDPKRGNQIIAPPAYTLIVFKDPLVPERAATLSAGFVANPFGESGTKLSVDYSHICRSREAGGPVGSALVILYYEDRYPGRVTRLPLTAEDAAKGYTAGAVTQIDTSYTTVGWTTIDAVDARIDLPFRSARHGDIGVFLAGTWQPLYRHYLANGYPLQNLTNRIDGALALRGNAGLNWTKGRLELGLAAQYYGAYSVEQGSALTTTLNPRLTARQGSARIPASVTLDLAVAYRIPFDPGAARGRTLDLRFGIEDLLDHRPATVVSQEGGYSGYGDPRRRRFEFTLALAI
ncbi:TonB-dependent receptor [Sphingomonas sp. TF3]|uniref:TonB-dependent receptor plug domain-containing protein n=1 Tax=Sphingomonas sp. TF3 TaxID=2495580 RepID=UPI000F878A1F|nr:TonB-dependent receptor plug domain-containing protein [Sphingomonas sp. TF3]RUN75968.1 TonB-dependent receptor [Sphingomonas sp. TF3]